MPLTNKAAHCQQLVPSSARIVFKGYEAQVHTWGNPSSQPLILLHGFMQRGLSWSTVARHFARHFFVVAPDLPGHGSTLLPETADAFSFDAHLELVKSVVEHTRCWPAEPVGEAANSKTASAGTIDAPDTVSVDTAGVNTTTPAADKRPFLVGYSMGGRIAAAYACAYPKSLAGCVFESAGLGPVTEEERKAKAHQNEALCNRLTTEPLETFVNVWEHLPLFASQQNLSQADRSEQRAVRLSNNPSQLAASLRFAGQQVMQDMRKSLIQLPIAWLYMAGRLDAAYAPLAQSLSALSSTNEHSWQNAPNTQSGQNAPNTQSGQNAQGNLGGTRPSAKHERCPNASQNSLLAPAIPVHKIEIIEQAGHNIHLEQPEKYCRRLEAFFHE